MQPNQSELLSAELDYALPEETKFALAENHFLSMDWKGVHYERVFATCLFPLTKPKELISVLDGDKKELCLIRQLSDFHEEQQQVLSAFLANHYNRPKIVQIKQIKVKTNHYILVAVTNQGKQEIVVESSRMGIFKVIGNETIYLADISGNNYCIDSYSSLDKKSKYLIHPYLI